MSFFPDDPDITGCAPISNIHRCGCHGLLECPDRNPPESVIHKTAYARGLAALAIIGSVIGVLCVVALGLTFGLYQ